MKEKIVQTAGRDQLGGFAPEFAHYNDDILFGENWNNRDINLKTRCIVTLVALMASGITDSSLVYHLENAKAHGGLFGLGQPNDAYARYFVGQSYLNPVAGQSGVNIANVTFEPGCRNNWHIHQAKTGGGQLLLCTEGCGWYQEWGREARKLYPGDAVEIPAGVKHWHGAAKDSWFSHLAVELPGENTSSEWLEAVTDEAYNALQ